MIAHLFEFARTGRLPSEALPKASFTLPNISSSIELNGDVVVASYQSKLKEIEDTGGWTSTAFQKNLINPN